MQIWVVNVHVDHLSHSYILEGLKLYEILTKNERSQIYINSCDLIQNWNRYRLCC